MSSLTILPLILAMMIPASAQEGATQERQRIRLPAGDPVAQEPATDAQEEQVLRTYELRLMVNRMIPDEPSWTSGLPDERSEELRAATAEKRKAAVEALMRGLKTHVTPAWDGEQNAMHNSGTGVLVVLAKASQHEWIMKFLNHVLEKGLEYLQLDTHLIQIPRGGLKSYGIAPPVATLEKLDALDTLVERISQDPDSETLSKPSMLLKSLGSGTVTVAQEIAYVKEWDVRFVVPEKQLIADPVIDVIQEGIVLDVFAVTLPDGSHGIDLDLECTSIERPIPTRMIRIATEPAKEVSVSRPEVTRVSLRSSFVLDEGSAVVFATAAMDDEHDLLVVVTAERLNVRQDQDPFDKPESDRRR